MDLLILDVKTLVFCFNFFKILVFQTQFWTDCTGRKLNCTNILLENFWLPTCRWGCNLLGVFSLCDDSFPPPIETSQRNYPAVVQFVNIDESGMLADLLWRLLWKSSFNLESSQRIISMVGSGVFPMPKSSHSPKPHWPFQSQKFNLY